MRKQLENQIVQIVASHLSDFQDLQDRVLKHMSGAEGPLKVWTKTNSELNRKDWPQHYLKNGDKVDLILTDQSKQHLIIRVCKKTQAV